MADDAEAMRAIEAEYDNYLAPLFKVIPRESVVLGARAMVAAVLDLAPAE